MENPVQNDGHDWDIVLINYKKYDGGKHFFAILWISYILWPFLGFILLEKRKKLVKFSKDNKYHMDDPVFRYVYSYVLVVPWHL